MIDYTPYIDQHPELHLVPSSTVSVAIWNFKERVDYVQDLNLKDKDGKRSRFFLVVKDGKQGVLYHHVGFPRNPDHIALPTLYDSIEFLYKRGNSFGAIVKKCGKFGLFFWKLGVFINYKHVVQTEYESMDRLQNNRIRGVKDNTIMYFDETGHILK